MNIIKTWNLLHAYFCVPDDFTKNITATYVHAVWKHLDWDEVQTDTMDSDFITVRKDGVNRANSTSQTGNS